MDRTSGFYPADVGSNPTGGTKNAQSPHNSVGALCFLLPTGFEKSVLAKLGVAKRNRQHTAGLRRLVLRSAQHEQNT